MATQWLFIPLTAPFHLPKIHVRETWHDPYGFHFFPGYYASKCTPRFLHGRATLTCSIWLTVHCGTDKVDEHDDTITLVNFL
jgi:hypothetical protein